MTLPPLFCRHFPTFVTDYSHDDVDVFWYQSAFSQSRYPPGQKGNYMFMYNTLLVHISVICIMY